jgi:folate-dependent phosphoribosylglycinamide formyltransferase PurN
MKRTVLITGASGGIGSAIARQLAEKYSLPLIEHDIRAFYRQHGEESIALTSPRRCELRDKWSDELYEKVCLFQVDAGVLAGFIPLSNIASRIPCLNVHPGDLTRCDSEGRRLYAGLHVLPVEKAILNGEKSLRSSVILAQGYCGSGEKEMDTGYVLGISQKVPVDLQGYSLEELKKIKSERIAPPCDDALRRVALANIETLKVDGDHLVLPEVTNLFAAGRYGTDEQGRLCFLENGGAWKTVSTVEIFKDRSFRCRYE